MPLEVTIHLLQVETIMVKKDIINFKILMFLTKDLTMVVIKASITIIKASTTIIKDLITTIKGSIIIIKDLILIIDNNKISV
jgi:hypothetical protein